MPIRPFPEKSLSHSQEFIGAPITSQDQGYLVAYIDGGARGNAARWINHSCNPNCEADMVEIRGHMHVFIEALRDIKTGEELSYDYGLEIDAPYTPKLKREFACSCGHKGCRGTMLAPKKRGRKAA